MFLSQKEIDRIVNDGGLLHFDHWVYDIIVDRLEATGFRRKTSIAEGGPVALDGSIYCRPDGHMVVVGTQRTCSPMTFIRSIPLPGKEGPEDSES